MTSYSNFAASTNSITSGSLQNNYNQGKTDSLDSNSNYNSNSNVYIPPSNNSTNVFIPPDENHFNFFAPPEPVVTLADKPQTNHFQNIETTEQSQTPALTLTAYLVKPEMRAPAFETTYLAHGTGAPKGLFESLAIRSRLGALLKRGLNNVQPSIKAVSAKDPAIMKKGGLPVRLHQMNIFKDTKPAALEIVRKITEENTEFLEKRKADPHGPIQLKSVHIEGISRGCASALEAAFILKNEFNTEVETLTLQHPVKSARHAGKQLLRFIKPLSSLLVKGIDPKKWSHEHLIASYTDQKNTSTNTKFKHTKLRMMTSENDIFASKKDHASVLEKIKPLFLKYDIATSEKGHCKELKGDSTSIIGGNWQNQYSHQPSPFQPKLNPYEEVSIETDSIFEASSSFDDSLTDLTSNESQSFHSADSELYDTAESASFPLEIDREMETTGAEQKANETWPGAPGLKRHIYTQSV